MVKAFETLGFSTVRVGNHISMARKNADGTTTPLTMPNRDEIKGSTLRVICTQAGISQEEFMKSYENS